jgi:alkylation response protein AidB-like acyl-CoA dehydrogenase
MSCTAHRDGGDWVVNGTKHFISGADHADFFIVFVATGVDETPKGPKKRITCFLVDRGHPGFTVRDGYNRSATGATRTASSNSTIAACRMRRCWARSMAASR